MAEPPPNRLCRGERDSLPLPRRTTASGRTGSVGGARRPDSLPLTLGETEGACRGMGWGGPRLGVMEGGFDLGPRRKGRDGGERVAEGRGGVCF